MTLGTRRLIAGIVLLLTSLLLLRVISPAQFTTLMQPIVSLFVR